MKKSGTECCHKDRWRKLLRIMKLSIVLMLIGMLQVSASVSSQNKVSLKASNKKVAEVLKQIETETNLRFFYNETLINDQRTVSIQAKDAEVEQVLEQLFEGTDVQYRYFDDELILLTKPEQAAQHNNQQAQSITVKGVVQDASGEPLPGVNVYDKSNPQNGVITGVDGTYTINVSEGEILVYSFIGFEEQEITVAGRTEINVTLVEEYTQLDEVVAIGYGSKTKATITGAVETVGSEVFESRSQRTVAETIQGLMPGLQVTRSSGDIFGNTTGLMIRGVTSRDGAGVLIIIDGVPQPENDASPLNTLNPNDVESITVLKDAQAAIYGSRAAGGVILITTKSGVGKKPKLQYNANFAINDPAVYPKKANLHKMFEYYDEAFKNDGIDVHNYSYLEEELANVTPETEWIKGPFSDTPKMSPHYYDWTDILFDPSLQQTHQFSVSGAGEKNTYYLSVGILDADGPVADIDNSVQRYDLRVKNDVQVTDYLKIISNVSFSKLKNQRPTRFYDAVGLSQDIWSNHFPHTPEGNYYNFGGFLNPLAYINAGNTKLRGADLTGQLGFELKPLKDLVITGNYNLNYNENTTDEFSGIVQHHDYDEVPTVKLQPNHARMTSNKSQHQTVNLYLNYKKKIGIHGFDLMMGGSHEEAEYKYFVAGRRKLASESVPFITMGDPEEQITSGSASHWAIDSYFGRLNYSILDKYLLEGIIRFDGSSRFAEDYRWGTYGGFSGAWLLSEEDFMKGISWLNFLKLRASYGEMGNERISGDFGYMPLLYIGGYNLFGNPNDPTQSSLATDGGRLASPTQTWETIKINNFGLDFRVLRDRLQGSFDYFIKKTEDMLVTREFPKTLGIAPNRINGGSLETKGFELSLKWNDIIGGNFKYRVGFTLSDDNTKVTSLEDAVVPGFGWNHFVEGYDVGSYFGYNFDGFITNQAELDEYKQLAGVPGNIAIGDARYADLDGDGKIEGTIYKPGEEDSGDMIHLGSNRRRYQYGIDLGFDWKGFDFNAFFMGIAKWEVMSDLQAPGSAWWMNPMEMTIGDFWSPENTDAFYPKASANGTTHWWNYQWSDSPYKRRDASFIKLKTITLGYSLPASLIEKINLSRVHFYVSGNDLWWHSNMPDGIDPELPFMTRYVPIPKVYSVGLDITF